ncbi:hypothetical protein jhhlp_005212 [Lomentospora prolificans]|uniref:nitric oxide dioxygenase n=1 Tax=Lomentospora prolificans TaxID=41688 RepID=A0A2N3N752_9PEZI|nr:hypothetical protein jhhlp_005212 [Lomentospora prolificans]
MALSYKQTQIVRATIPALKDHGERITTTFYRNMLQAHPELHNIFNDVNIANARQPRALTAVILKFASDINNISELIPRLERMCHKHCSLGIRPEHYQIVGKYLIDAFSEVLGPAMTPEARVAWDKAYWVLARMLIGREDQLYRGFESQGWKGWRKFKVTKKVQETDNIVSFYLTPKDGKPLPEFLPGQYISVKMEMEGQGYAQLRQYALSDAPRPDYYRITVKRDRGMQVKKSGMVMNVNPGLVSNIMLDDLQRGDEVEVSHPAGEIFLDPYSGGQNVPLVLISAGVGVAPMISILNSVMETQPMRPVSFIHGSQRDMAFEDHVRRVKQARPNVSVNIFKSRLAEADMIGVDYEYDVRVDLGAVSPGDLYLDHGSAEYYICGPEQFMVEMTDYLAMQGVSLGRVKFSPFSTGELEVRLQNFILILSSGVHFSIMLAEVLQHNDIKRSAQSVSGITRCGKFVCQFRTPGGYLEYGETFLAAAERIIRRETALEVNARRVAAVDGEVMGGVGHEKHYITIFVICEPRDERDEPSVTEPEECDGWEWKTWNQLRREADREIEMPLANVLDQNQNGEVFLRRSL